MTRRPVHYAMLRPEDFTARLAEAPIAYLPLGTLEWHGLHLPLGADGLQSQALFECLADDVGGMVLPMIFMGPDIVQAQGGDTFIGMDFFHRPESQWRQLPGSAYHLPDGHYAALIDDIAAQLSRAGFKILVAHGHGPSTRQFMALADDLRARHGLHCMTLWSGREDMTDAFQSDHAAANETSIMMHFYPELVDMDALDPDPEHLPEAVAGKDPRIHASPEYGQAVAEETRLAIGGLLRSLLDGLEG